MRSTVHRFTGEEYNYDWEDSILQTNSLPQTPPNLPPAVW